MKYTFDYDLFSDLHKEAWGHRPRGHRFYDPDTTDDQRQEIWDYTLEVLDDTIEEERRRQENALSEFKALVQKTIELGASDEETALRWLVQDQTFYFDQDVDQWVWEKGILFTDYGREIAEKLKGIVEFKEWHPDWEVA